MDNNFVHIRGTVRDINPKGFIVDCKRTSGLTDKFFIRCYAPVIHNVDIGQKIEANGVLKTFNCKDTGEKKTYIEASSLMSGELISRLDDEQTVELTGTLCKKGELHITKKGATVFGFALAVNESDTKSYYPQCVCWGATASIAQTFAVGTRVKLVGRLQRRGYEKDGKKKHTYEVSCFSLEVLTK